MNGFFRGDYKECQEVRPSFPPDNRKGSNARSNSSMSRYEQLLASFPSNQKSNSRDASGKHKMAQSHVLGDDQSGAPLSWQPESAPFQNQEQNGGRLENTAASGETGIFGDVMRWLKWREEKVEEDDVMFKSKYCRVGAATTALGMDYIEVVSI